MSSQPRMYRLQNWDICYASDDLHVSIGAFQLSTYIRMGAWSAVSVTGGALREENETRWRIAGRDEVPPFQMGFCLKHDSDGTQCPTLQSTQSVMGLEIASGIAYASSFCFDQIRTSFPGIASNHGCQTQGPCARASSFCVTGESLTSFLLLLKTIEMINNCRGNYVTLEWATGSPRPHSECTNDSFSTPPPPKENGGDL